MNDLLITIQKAAHIFGLSSEDTSANCSVIHQVNRKGWVDHEDILRLSEHIPGSYKIFSAYLGVEPKELRPLLETRLYKSDLFFTQLNTALNKRYPEIARVDLGPTEGEWEAAKGKFMPMVNWIGRKLNWMMK